MGMAKRVGVAISLLVLLCAVWVGAHAELPTDAVAPDNDRIAWLERRIAALETRLEKFERGSTGTVPVQWTAPFTPTPPQPLPKSDEQELNGVKFRLFLIGDERTQGVPDDSATRGEPTPMYTFGGVQVIR